MTIEEAAIEGYPVKVITNENSTIKYNHIELKEGQYFGVEYVDRQQIFVPLKKDEINTIRPKDKVLSIIGNIAIAWPIVGLVVFAINGGDLYPKKRSD